MAFLDRATRDHPAVWRDRSRIVAWLVAVFSVAAAVLLKSNVPSLGHDPDLLFLLAVMAAASLGGLGPGLLATILAAGAQLHLFVEPIGPLAATDSAEVGTLAVWMLESVLISVMADAMRKAKERAVRAGKEAGRHAAALETAREGLEHAVELRTAELVQLNASLRGEIEERTRSQVALGRAEVAVQAAYHVLQNLTEGCQVISPEWTYLYVNDSAAAQGRQPVASLLGRTMMEVFPGIESSEMFGTLQRCMKDRVHGSMINEFLFPDGGRGWFELRFVPVPEGLCILSVDITERRKLEDQFRQAQKMEAVGRLAGGVAHDFNNLLSVILSYAGMGAATLAADDPLREDLLEIERAGERAAELTGQLLAFSRQQMLKPRVFDLDELLPRMEKMLSRLVGEDVEIRVVCGPSAGRICADPGQVEQIVMNLVVNARDAMPGGGVITIETGKFQLDAEYARTHLGTAPGPHVMLAVSDTGLGMDDATKSRIFEPFFTTKDLGKGTGLGLSTVLGIVQQSGGSIWVYSEPGRGTTFKAYFPSVDDPVDIPTAHPALPAPATGTTILLVEDDAPLRVLVEGILTRQGYVVLAAPTPAEALVRSAEHAGQIDLLLTDVVMPGMNGRELAERILAERPRIRVLYMSGYTGEVVMDRGVMDRGAAFLGKPITPRAVLQRVAEALDASTAPPPGPV